MTPDAPRNSRRAVPSVVLLISAANAAIVVLIGCAQFWVPESLPSPIYLGLFAVTFVLVGGLPVRLHFSQHRACFTLSEVTLVVGLFHLGPLWLGLVAGVGEAIRGSLTRASAVKTWFNALSYSAAAAAAGATFVAAGHLQSHETNFWLPATAAATTFGIVNSTSMALVIARAEGRPFVRTLLDSLPTAATTAVLGAALGLVVQRLWLQGPAYPLLLLPVALGVWVNGRHATAQRDEHLRIERLYQATARSTDVGGGRDVVAMMGQEAMGLVTGRAAFCVLADGTGRWSGRAVSKDGVVEAPKDVISALLALGIHPNQSRTMAVVPSLSRFAPDADVMILARSPRNAGADVIVGVLRRKSIKRTAEAGLQDTLAAYVAHGSVVAANSALVFRLEESLAAQMEANKRKDEFVSTISHELRTPLTVVLGSVQTLSRLGDRLEASERDRLMLHATEQGQRLRMLIEDLLLVAAAEQGKIHCQKESISVAQLALDVEADLPDDVRPYVQVINSADGIWIRSDRSRVRQILTNLVQNARKYAPASSVEVRFEPGIDQVRISVVDHGPGIPQSQRARVFQRFVQLDQSSTRSEGGTGLGLYICKSLADRLDADLSLISTPGGGCTFTLAIQVGAQPTPAGSGLVRPDDSSKAKCIGLMRRPNLQELATAGA